MQRIFAADIGATNSRFALFRAHLSDAGAPLLSLEREQWLLGAEHASFQSALQTLSGKAGPQQPNAPLLSPSLIGEAPISLAVIAAAGPVEGDICRVSNLPWVISRDLTRSMLGISEVFLINDFAAQAHACLLPGEIDATPILGGAARPDMPIAVAGAGTGFGKALLLDAGPVFGAKAAQNRRRHLARLKKARVLASEGGHAVFPFVGEEEARFARFATKRTGGSPPIGDTVVSGSGLATLFAFHTGIELPERQVTARVHEHPDVLPWFARFYARFCRDFVLDTLALGGLFITGGMALRVPVLTHPAFAEEFYASRVQEKLLRNVPVHHIRKMQAGLWGAALYGLLRL